MDDEQIIELYWNRKEKAIEETSRKYSRLCRTIAMNILGNLPDAEECENDTYLALWNAIPSTRPNLFLPFFQRWYGTKHWTSTIEKSGEAVSVS